MYRASASLPQINRASGYQSAASAGAGIGKGKQSVQSSDSIESSDTRHSKRLRAESMKDESSAKLTSDSQSGYATSSNSLQVRTSRPSMGMEMSKVEQAPCTPLLSRRPEEGALFLPCDERCINATCSTFPGPRPKQPFPSNNELGGATPCSVYRASRRIWTRRIGDTNHRILPPESESARRGKDDDDDEI